MALTVTPCNPYDARVGHRELVKMPDGVSAFKMYFVSIVGRERPQRYEWDRGDLSPETFLAQFRAMPWEGVGFVTAFPHITKVFRFAPKAEILMLVAAYDTRTGKPINLDRGEGFTEFACYAEALLAADEYRFWAEAQTVPEYLAVFSDCTKATVESHTKLAAHAAGNRG
jgi:hypothetical protein